MGKNERKICSKFSLELLLFFSSGIWVCDIISSLILYFPVKATKICFDNFWQVEQTKSSSFRFFLSPVCARPNSLGTTSEKVIEKWTNYFNKDVRAPCRIAKIRWKKIIIILNFKQTEIFGLLTLWWLTYRFYAGWPFFLFIIPCVVVSLPVPPLR